MVYDFPSLRCTETVWDKLVTGKSKNCSEITAGALVSSEISVPVNVFLSFKYPHVKMTSVSKTSLNISAKQTFHELLVKCFTYSIQITTLNLYLQDHNFHS